MKFEPYRCLFLDFQTKTQSSHRSNRGTPLRLWDPASPPVNLHSAPGPDQVCPGVDVILTVSQNLFPTPKLFIFILSWHFNMPLCSLSDPLPKMEGRRKKRSPLTRLSARGKKGRIGGLTKQRTVMIASICMAVYVFWVVGVEACAHKYAPSMSFWLQSHGNFGVNCQFSLTNVGFWRPAPTFWGWSPSLAISWRQN